uniref:Uncharacterized protein n=1 Tax=Anguilla anguilla TaxID=7936 RepID=A0A0E9S2Z3_ANGAN
MKFSTSTNKPCLNLGSAIESKGPSVGYADMVHLTNESLFITEQVFHKSSH